MALQSTIIPGPGGPLELCYALPTEPLSPTRPPLLFVHGALCSAHDYMFLLPYFASQGYPAYSVSVRGHGASYTQSFVVKMFFTSAHNWCQDILCALRYVIAQHPDTAQKPVLGGHSLGGGMVQMMASEGYLSQNGNSMGLGGWLSSWFISPTVSTEKDSLISGLILLAPAPLSGRGKEIQGHWSAIEAPDGYDSILSPRTVMETADQVRAVFFSKEAKEETVQMWIAKCKTPVESARAGLACFRKMGEYDRVLKNIGGFEVGHGDDAEEQGKRRILFLDASKDLLVLPAMVNDEYNEYQKFAAAGDRTVNSTACMKFTVDGAGHHLMMDAQWEQTAEGIVKWLEGR